MNKLGAQCQTRTGKLEAYNKIVKPVAAMGINVVDPMFYRRLKLDNPHVKTAYRDYPNWLWADRPERRGEEFARHLRAKTSPFVGDLNYVLGNNEEVHAHMVASFDAADRFMLSFIEGVHDNFRDTHAIVLNAGCGNFSDDIVNFPRTLAALDRCGKCLLGLHEYDWPTMTRLHFDGLQEGNGGMWLSLKWKQVIRAIRQLGYQNVRVAITECGVDDGVGRYVTPDKPLQGWRALTHDLDWSRRMYLRDLRWYHDALMRDDDVEFALIFGCGMDGDWATFDIADSGIVEEIAKFKIYPEVK